MFECFCIFQNYLTLTAGSPECSHRLKKECSKGSTTLDPVLETAVVFMVSYGNRTFWHEPRLTIWLMLILCEIELSMPERIHLKIIEAVEKALFFLKNIQKGTSAM